MVRVSVGQIETPDEIWVRGKLVPSFWLPGVSNPYLARHLIIPARGVMGFWSIDGVPIKQKAELTGLSAGEFIRLNRMLWESPTAAIHFCRTYGLPASASVKLEGRFFCPSCKRWIVSLPCIRCWRGKDDDPDV